MNIRFLLLAAAAPLAWADVRLPAIVSDHMVVQRGMPVHVWGWADAGETVTASFQGRTATATAGSQGTWSLYLRPAVVGGELTVSGKNTITIHDVVVGDVWVASGQSNMEWPLSRANRADEEIAAANHPELRMFLVKKAVADQPANDVSGAWVVCTPESIKGQSAVSYFFAREIAEKQGVAVGVINTYWGGTPAQSWTSSTALEQDGSLRFILNDWKSTLDRYPDAKAKYDDALAKYRETKQGTAPRAPEGPGHPNTPASLYNAMIAPVTGYPIRGAIWYQGESNASERHAWAYRRLFSTMIEDWRHAWGQGAFPFYFVQLANYQTNGWWPLLRESQSETLALRNTGMAVITDIGNAKDIHPTNKQDVGHRLALLARAGAYGEKIVASGPLYRAMSTENGRVRLYFDAVGGGLAARGGGALTGFEIAGADGNWAPAEASIEGDTVVASSAQVAQPVAARYAWTDNPETANLMNKDELPASPFRTRSGQEK